MNGGWLGITLGRLDGGLHKSAILGVVMTTSYGNAGTSFKKNAFNRLFDRPVRPPSTINHYPLISDHNTTSVPTPASVKISNSTEC